MDTTVSEGETEPLDAPESLVGRMLEGRYYLEETVDLGGMGIIFRAEQTSTDRTVAVKVLKPSRSDETDLLHRFRREASVLAALSHPNIVSLIDYGRDAGGLTYLVMEFVDGETFRDVLEGGELTLGEMVEVFAKTTSALAEAHEAEIIHRDLKFENIMVSRQADDHLDVTVLDFGVAKPLSEQNRLELTSKGQVPGTPAVIAPELVDEHPPSPRSDLYSLGVVFYTALAGAPPYRGENDLDLMRAHKNDPLPDLDAKAANYVPDELVDLTESLLEKEPEGRPEDAARVRRRLDRVVREVAKLPLDDYRYEAGDEGPAEFKKYSEYAESREESKPESGEFPDWVRSFFGD